MAAYHHAPLYYVKADDPDLPAFYFDPIINPISAFRSDRQGGLSYYNWHRFLNHTTFSSWIGVKSASEWDDDDDDLPLPDGMFPLLDEEPLYTDNTALGITLYW